MTLRGTTQPTVWLTDFLLAVDSLEIDRFLAYFADDAICVMGKKMVGHDEIRAGVERLYGGLHGMSHQVVDCWQPNAHTVVAEFATVYTRSDDRSVTVESVGVFHLEGDVIHDYRVFFDPRPIIEGIALDDR